VAQALTFYQQNNYTIFTITSVILQYNISKVISPFFFFPFLSVTLWINFVTTGFLSLSCSQKIHGGDAELPNFKFVTLLSLRTGECGDESRLSVCNW